MFYKNIAVNYKTGRRLAVHSQATVYVCVELNRLTAFRDIHEGGEAGDLITHFVHLA